MVVRDLTTTVNGVPAGPSSAQSTALVAGGRPIPPASVLLFAIERTVGEARRNFAGQPSDAARVRGHFLGESNHTDDDDRTGQS
jgi:hypothetical protein